MERRGRRLQVLLDEQRYERLRQRSIASGKSIGELVRMALDEADSDSGGSQSEADRPLAGHRSPVNDPGFLQADIEWFTPPAHSAPAGARR